MSVANGGNRSQPDDYIVQLLHTLFNAPAQTMADLQSVAVGLSCLFVVYIV